MFYWNLGMNCTKPDRSEKAKFINISMYNKNLKKEGAIQERETFFSF